MQAHEEKEFCQILTATMEALSKSVTPAAVGLWWSVLRDYDLDAVRKAFSRHLQTSKFPPTPAEILEQVRGSDGRPEANEAWAIAPKTEAETACWTDEIRDAWGIASELYAEDPVGARMAFRDAYERLVAEARREGRPVRWSMTMGHDVEGRDEPIRAAVAAGRITFDQSVVLLRAPKDVGPIVELVARTALPKAGRMTAAERAEGLAALEKIRRIFGEPNPCER